MPLSWQSLHPYQTTKPSPSEPYPAPTMSYLTAEVAESAFYAAFEARSLDAMMVVWANDDSIACIHPLAAPLNGRAAVATGWLSMFEAAGQ